MSKKWHLRHLVGILMAFGLVFANVSVSFADEEEVEVGTAEISISDKQEAFVDRIKTELQLSKSDYKQVLGTVNDTKSRLEHVHEEELSLQEYIENLEKNVEATELKLRSVLEQIAERENEIKKIEEEVEIREVALEYQKELLQDYLKIMYQQQNEFLTFEENGNVNAFKLLLSDNNVSDNVNQLEYYNMLSQTGMQLTEKLDGMFIELSEKKADLAEENEKLTLLKEEIEQEKVQLELQKTSKQQLLDATQGQEEIYGQLLEQTKEQQGELLLDVKALNDALNFVERKIEQDGENFDPEDYESLFDYKTKSLYQFTIDNLSGSGEGLNWPVAPNRGISAYYHDSGYKGVFGVQHNAIDIPEYQGSPIRSAGDGVVYTAKDNGYGYSYIIVAHADGLMTVYGHVNDILVDEGDKVMQGSIIGLTGGMPGTKGAGYMTTGPHLHFEVHKNGTPVDPLDYLPLTVLSENFALNMPEKYLDMWEEQLLADGE